MKIIIGIMAVVGIVFTLLLLISSVMYYFTRKRHDKITQYYDTAVVGSKNKNIKLHNPIIFEGNEYSLTPGECKYCDLYSICGKNDMLAVKLRKMNKSCLNFDNYCYHKMK